MRRPTFVLAAHLAVLLAVAWGAAAEAIALSIRPALPTEADEIVLLIGGDGSCPSAESVDRTPGIVDVVLSDFCLSPPQPFLLEVPIGVLYDRGALGWEVRVQLFGETTSLPVTVAPAPFEITIEPPHPRSGEEVTAVIRGTTVDCGLSFEPVEVSGRLLSMPHQFGCPILPPGPGLVEVPVPLGSLGVGTWVAQVVDYGGEVLASRRFAVGRSGDCVPTATILCLHDGRFSVEAAWKTARGAGPASALPQTRESGAFWFFRADNLELSLKILDACATPRRSFWVFASGLTNVEVELRVTDLWSGESWVRRHAAGGLFEPIVDLSALQTCDAVPSS